jgi:hypothetical protein
MISWSRHRLPGTQKRERENWEKRSTRTHGSAAESAVALQENVKIKKWDPETGGDRRRGTPPAHGQIAQNLKKTPDHGGRPPTGPGKTRGPSRPRRPPRDLGGKDARRNRRTERGQIESGQETPAGKKRWEEVTV